MQLQVESLLHFFTRVLVLLYSWNLYIIFYMMQMPGLVEEGKRLCRIIRTLWSNLILVLETRRFIVALTVD